jgi:hypothetical protein
LSIQGISEPPSGTPKLAVSAPVSALGIVEQCLHFGVERAVLREQLAHVLGTPARGCLVGLRAHPLDQAGLVERAHAHEHAAHGAVATDPVLAPVGQRVLDHGQVDRVENDDGVLVHAQRGRGVDPVAVPACGAQLGVDLAGVVATLGGDDDVAALEGGDVVRVLQRGFVLRHGGGFAARVGGGEEQRFDQVEVAFRDHAVHQHGTDHATPAYESYEFHVNALSKLKNLLSPGSSCRGGA